MKIKITSITIGRTISMDNYSNEKQEVIILVEHNEHDKVSQIARAAYEEAEKVFSSIYPKYGKPNKEYESHMKGVITALSQKAIREAQEADQIVHPLPPSSLEKVPQHPFGMKKPANNDSDISQASPISDIKSISNKPIEKVKLDITTGKAF